MVSSGKIEKLLLYEFQKDQYTVSFWTTLANALQRSLLDVPKLLEARILLQLSESIPDGPEAPLVLIAAFFIISLTIDWNLTG